MKRQSAGILLYKRTAKSVEVLLGHPGGPFWAKKDLGAWSIPKGEFLEEEDAFSAACREFKEELGAAPPDAEPIELGLAKQASGKVVYAWAVEGDFDVHNLKSGTFEMEWPPRSGKQQAFPELDKAGWFTLGAARTKLVKGQVPLLEKLAEILGADFERPADTQEETPQISLF